jgi:uncharacterized protein DUF4387
VKEFRLLSTSGILGYGFPEASLAAGLERRPDAIGVDGGKVSTSRWRSFMPSRTRPRSRGGRARAGSARSRTGVLGPSLFARLYGVRAEDVLFTVYDAALAFRATLPRLVPAGDIGDTDFCGAQQHRPLLEVEIPV